MINLLRKYRKFNLRQKDILATNLLLNPIIHKLNNYLPVNKYSLRPSTIGLLLNDIYLNGRKSILEFGAGISTIFTAKFFQLHNIDGYIVAVDHDEEWLEWLQQFLKKEGINEQVRLIHSPLRDITDSPYEDKLHWYDEISLLKKIDESLFDLIIIDGPPGEGKSHRYFALPFLLKNNLLQDKYLIVLDDVNRDIEKDIVVKWQNETGLRFNVVNHKIALTYKGLFYDPQID